MSTEPLPRDKGARKQVLVTIDADNRDKGKSFIITELPAMQAERWFRRVLAYLSRLGVALPAMAGMTGMASMAGFSPMQMYAWIDDEDLMREVMSCVKVRPEGVETTRGLVATDTEEPATIILLRMEVLALHVGFSVAVALWVCAPGVAAALQIPMPPEVKAAMAASTQTSPGPAPSPSAETEPPTTS